jgi:GR25 family glycosyltransferase involved in LPS biosynthesis
MCIFSSFNINCEEKKLENTPVVYVINLDRSHDRLEKMKAQLDALGIEFIRFRAIDGSKLKIVNLNTNEVIENAPSRVKCIKIHNQQ